MAKQLDGEGLSRARRQHVCVPGLSVSMGAGDQLSWPPSMTATLVAIMYFTKGMKRLGCLHCIRILSSSQEKAPSGCERHSQVDDNPTQKQDKKKIKRDQRW